MAVGGMEEGEADDKRGAKTAEEEVILPRCYFDLEIGGVSAGRLVFELFSNVVPKTCENFKKLCQGDCGMGKTTEKPLHYKGSVFHRIIKDFMIQGGDFSKQNGTGGESIYGGTFEDENFEMKHDQPYLLSMANRGKDTNGSQFFILTQNAPHLDGVHVVFGRVVYGQELVKQIEGLPVDRKSRPLQDVRIADCGELVLIKKKKKEKKAKKVKKPKSDSEKSSGELSGSESENEKKGRKHRSDSSDSDEEESKIFCSITEGEVPAIPENRFLMRASKSKNDKDEVKGKEKVEGRKQSRLDRSRSRSRGRDGRRSGGRYDRDRDTRDRRSSPVYTRGARNNNDGKKIKGRGRVCYRPVSRSRSRSRSKTPPHWRAEARRVISMKEYEEKEKHRRQREDEIRRRQDERQKRHGEHHKDIKEKVVSDPDEETLKENKEVEDEHKDVVLAPDVSAADKAVEDLTAQIQIAASSNDGVVYYQHLYRNRRIGDKLEGKPNKGLLDVSSSVQGFEPLTSYSTGDNENENPPESPPANENVPSKEDEEEELRLRRELLRKRMKEWEDSSSDDDGKANMKSSVVVDSKNGVPTSESKAKGLSVRDGEAKVDSARKERKTSRSRSPSGRRDSFRRRGRSSSRSKSRSRSRKRSRRSRSRSRSRGYSRKHRSRESRSNSRSHSRRRNRRR